MGLRNAFYIYITLLEKYLTLFCFAKTWWISMKPLARGDLEPSYASVNFSRLSIASVDDEHHLSEIVFSALVGFSL